MVTNTVALLELKTRNNGVLGDATLWRYNTQLWLTWTMFAHVPARRSDPARTWCSTASRRLREHEVGTRLVGLRGRRRRKRAAWTRRPVLQEHDVQPGEGQGLGRCRREEERRKLRRALPPAGGDRREARPTGVGK
ncbi:hypothetical protein Q5P01_000569 [Channa striata]|uniref:Uncharacterized protein n=1 Tax=Channa striata TaxID=64152 RepID=A0AA88LMD9_CHASR|nr:hypothetical protein Q5P01_000569 [Channa striata]